MIHTKECLWISLFLLQSYARLIANECMQSKWNTNQYQIVSEFFQNLIALDPSLHNIIHLNERDNLKESKNAKMNPNTLISFQPAPDWPHLFLFLDE